jgi:hypothetical protein
VADGNLPCIRRDRSTTPIQALTLLNDPVFVECAQALGARTRQAALPATPVGAAPDTDGRLRFAFRTCLSRSPSGAELAALRELVSRQQRLGMGEAEVWAGVGRALLNLEEFTTRE